LAGASIGLFGWDLSKPETLKHVNTKGSTEFAPHPDEVLREKKWAGWQKAVQRSLRWEEGVDEE
jgi:glycerol kinase